MPVSDTMHHRNAKTSVVDRRRADGALKPFIGDLQGWNSKAARLRALVGSPYSTGDDRGMARLAAKALLAEIRLRHAEFLAAIEGEPDHSRLSDVDAAFRRIIDQLNVASTAGRSAAKADT